MRRYFIQTAKFLTVIVAISFVFANQALAASSWETDSPMTISRSAGENSAVFSDRIYVIGGYTGAFTNAVEVYDPATDTWTNEFSPGVPFALMPTARANVSSIELNGKIYLIGGNSGITGGVSFSKNEAFDPVTNTWATKLSIPTPRRDIGVAVVGGILYAIGGFFDQCCGGSVTRDTVEAYDPTADTWSLPLAPMLTSRTAISTGIIDGEIYVAGGHNIGNVVLTALEVYDPAADTWVTKASMPEARQGATGSVVDGKLYVIGGFNSSGGAENTVFVYDPGTDAWSSDSTMPTARLSGSSAVVDGQIFVIGGFSGTGQLNINEAFTPGEAPFWTEITPVVSPQARFAHTAVVNPTSKRMTVFGGGFNFCCTGQTNEVWVLSSADDISGAAAWTQLAPTGALPASRLNAGGAYDESTNRMIIFGGNANFGNCFPAVNDTWILNNADGLGGAPAWTQLSTAGPPASRSRPVTAYDPASNRLIVFGGSNPCGPIFDDTWVLTNANDPTGAHTWIQLSPTGPIPSEFNTISVGAYDSANNRLIVIFPRTTLPDNLENIWILENASGVGGTPNWIKIMTSGTPPDISFTQIALDEAENRAVMLGDIDTNETFVLEHANGLGGTPTWTTLRPSVVPTLNRDSYTSVFFPDSGSMTVFGGRFFSVTQNNEAWVLSNASLSANAPPVADLIANVSDQLQEIINSDPDSPIADKMDDVRDKLLVALEELDKTPPDKQAAMGNIEGAVGDLEAAVSAGILDLNQATPLMDQLAGAARQLASDARDKAIAEGGDPVKTDDAQKALDDGDDLRGMGAFKPAVNKYKDALAIAEGA